MASLTEIEIRLKAVEDAVFGATEIPDFMININAPGVDFTQIWCYGIHPDINNGNQFIGWKSTVASPTSDSDFDEYGYAK